MTHGDASPRLGRRSRALLAGALIVLLAGVSLLPLRGLWLLYTDHGVDMQSRWQETHYFLRGVDPNVHGIAASRSERANEALAVFEDLTIPGRASPIGVYPPWSYLLAAPLHWPDELRAATLWYVAINALALALLVAWTASRGLRTAGHLLAALAPPNGLAPETVRTLAAAVFTVALLASGGLTRTLVVGNYGVVVLLLLVAALVAVERGRPTLAGLLFGVALLKPTLSGPFVLAIAVLTWRRRPRDAVRAIVGATAVVVLASLAAWSFTGTDPLTSTRAAQSHVGWYATDGGGSTLLWERLLPAARLTGEDGHIVRLDQYAGMLAALAIGAALALLARRGTPLEQFGLAASIALTWSYHRPYDSLLLVFLLLALLERCIRLAAGHGVPSGGVPGSDGSSRSARFVESAALGTAALLVGATLWTPTRHLGWPDSTLLVQGIWLGAATLLALSVRRNLVPG